MTLLVTTFAFRTLPIMDGGIGWCAKSLESSNKIDVFGLNKPWLPVSIKVPVDAVGVMHLSHSGYLQDFIHPRNLSTF